MAKGTYKIIKDYSEYSTIQGILYIFQENQSIFGKIFWIAVVLLMLLLGTFWSVSAYQEWQEKQVSITK
jgi:hypothetical protein